MHVLYNSLFFIFILEMGLFSFVLERTQPAVKQARSAETRRPQI